MDLYKRVSFPIANAGLALRSIDSVYLSAFICSMAASSKYLAKIFPNWIQTSIVDNVHRIISINENISPYTDKNQYYQNGQLGTSYPTKFLLFHFLRPYLLLRIFLPR